jgi:hypothetical protein
MTVVWLGCTDWLVEPDLRWFCWALESMVDLSDARWLSCCKGVYLLMRSLGIISELEALCRRLRSMPFCCKFTSIFWLPECKLAA